jgi:hypothetical protein
MVVEGLEHRWANGTNNAAGFRAAEECSRFFEANPLPWSIVCHAARWLIRAGAARAAGAEVGVSATGETPEMRQHAVR